MTLADTIQADPNLRLRPVRYLGARKVRHEDGTQTKVAASRLFSQVQRFTGRDLFDRAVWKDSRGLVDETGETYVSVDDFTARVPCDRCPNLTATRGGHGVSLNPVRGTYNPAKGCNPRCEGATGPSCDCSCGGENHGGAHGPA